MGFSIPLQNHFIKFLNKQNRTLALHGELSANFEITSNITSFSISLIGYTQNSSQTVEFRPSAATDSSVQPTIITPENTLTKKPQSVPIGGSLSLSSTKSLPTASSTDPSKPESSQGQTDDTIPRALGNSNAAQPNPQFREVKRRQTNPDSTPTRLPVTFSIGPLYPTVTTTFEYTANPDGSVLVLRVVDQTLSVIDTTLPGAPSQSGAVTSGGAAGIAVGCIVAGLALGILVAYCLFAKRRKATPPSNPAPNPRYKDKTPSHPRVSAEVQLDDFLLEPTPDGKLSTELGSIGGLIQQHVEIYYHLHPVESSSDDLAQALTALGFSEKGPSPLSHIVSAALDTRSRGPMLRHVIARVAFNSTMLSSEPQLSTLPQPVAAFLQRVPPVESHLGDAEALSKAMNRWRQLCAFLLHPDRSHRSPLPPSADVSAQTQSIAQALDMFLGPFKASEHDGPVRQHEHLREVVTECAKFGYMVFSQPSEYRFVYSAITDDGRGGIVTCPGLHKVRDQHGRRCRLPVVLVSPVEA